MSTDSSLASQYPVYTGVWTNWSRGAVYGATLTLTRSNADILISFISFFVAWVGTCVFRIGCFVAHFARSSQDARDGLYHQQQAILRNASDPEYGFRMMISLGWAWRRRAKSAIFRVLGLVVMSLVCLTGFSVASLFSSQISSKVGNEVLLKGANCSIPTPTIDLSTVTGDLYDNWFVPRNRAWALRMQNAANYALQCYSTTGERQLECATFTQRRLPVAADMRAGCPFNSTICRAADANLFLDTGYLDSHEHFGMNAAPSERFLYRKVVHCAPLVTEGYVRTVNISNDTSYTVYNYSVGNSPPPYAYSNDAKNDPNNLFYSLG